MALGLAHGRFSTGFCITGSVQSVSDRCSATSKTASWRYIGVVCAQLGGWQGAGGGFGGRQGQCVSWVKLCCSHR